MMLKALIDSLGTPPSTREITVVDFVLQRSIRRLLEQEGNNLSADHQRLLTRLADAVSSFASDCMVAEVSAMREQGPEAGPTAMVEPAKRRTRTCGGPVDGNRETGSSILDRLLAGRGLVPRVETLVYKTQSSVVSKYLRFNGDEDMREVGTYIIANVCLSQPDENNNQTLHIRNADNRLTLVGHFRNNEDGSVLWHELVKPAEFTPANSSGYLNPVVTNVGAGAEYVKRGGDPTGKTDVPITVAVVPKEEPAPTSS